MRVKLYGIRTVAATTNMIPPYDNNNNDSKNK